MALLRIANLKKSYNITKTQKQEVLKGIDIEFKSGDLVALLGESGCGKSTLINILGGLDTDYTGSVIIKGEFIRDFSEKQMDDYRKKRVGLIFQNYNLIPHMTIKENVEIAMSMSDIDGKTKHERAMDLLKLVGLGDYAGKYPNQLSGGQKQRVAIARALANNPTIILADEPTGALDSKSADVVLQILKKIAQTGKLVIIVTHSEKVASGCSRIIKMEDGVIADDQVVNKLHIDSKRDKEIVPKSIKTKDLFKLSSRNVKQKKSRSMLVSLGMAIGMAAVLLILCLSSGLSNYVNKIYGENTQSLQLIASSDETIDDSIISTVESMVGSSVSSVTQTQTVSNEATYSYTDPDDAETTYSDTLSTFSAYYSGVFKPTLIYGEYTDDDDTYYYIVISEALARAISSGVNFVGCIGETITITTESGSQDFVISGVFSDENYSVAAYVSENGLVSALGVSSSDELEINTLIVMATDTTYVSAVKEDLVALGLTVSQETSDSETVLKYIDLGTTALTAVGAISTVVSAIMIFIVLYISVSERMKEIGILRAVGARRSDIRKMFMFEAGMLGFVGGCLAVAFCFVISLITNLICASSLGMGLISYNVVYYLLGILVSVIISVLAGIAPAIRASDLDPVESLRAE